MYKVKSLIFTIVALSLLIIEPSISFAQNNTVKRSEMETVNMSRAFEALENGDTEEMLKYLGYEIKSNPKNGYAYAWAAYVYQYYDDFANVLYHSDKALKYIPSKDKEYVSFTYYTRARCYEDMEQYDKALGDYNKAISISPKMSDLYEDRAELYYKLGQYDLSDNDYMKITELDESKVIGYMGIGRNAGAGKICRSH